jgi:hypothetical protein
MIAITILLMFVGILLMPFFWQWYEVQLGFDPSDTKARFHIASFLTASCSLIYNVFSIAIKKDVDL